MPYPNEHAARVRNPGDFDPKSFKSKEIKPGIRIIIGKLRAGNGSMVTQTYRFAADKFTIEQAKKWLKDNNISYIMFEPASGEIKHHDGLKHIGVLGMKWGHRKGTSGKKSVKINTKKKVSKIDREKIERGKKIFNTLLVTAIATGIMLGKMRRIDAELKRNYRVIPKPGVIDLKFKEELGGLLNP